MELCSEAFRQNLLAGFPGFLPRRGASLYLRNDAISQILKVVRVKVFCPPGVCVSFFLVIALPPCASTPLDHGLRHDPIALA